MKVPVLVVVFLSTIAAQTPVSRFAGLTADLFAAPDARARRALLAAHRDLATRDLVAAMNKDASAEYDRRQFDVSLRKYRTRCGNCRSRRSSDPSEGTCCRITRCRMRPRFPCCRR